MPAASATRPIKPSRASISRTRLPLPTPPMAGLQDISPSVSRRWVRSRVRAPARAEAAAASAPAWPPPIPMTSEPVMCRSNTRIVRRGQYSLSYAEIPEHLVEQFLDIDLAGDAADGAQRQAQIFGKEFRVIGRRGKGMAQTGQRFGKRRAMAR